MIERQQSDCTCRCQHSLWTVRLKEFEIRPPLSRVDDDEMHTSRLFGVKTVQRFSRVQATVQVVPSVNLTRNRYNIVNIQSIQSKVNEIELLFLVLLLLLY